MFDRARIAALASPGIGRGSYRVGAIIADRKHIVSCGFNSYKSHPLLVGLEFPHQHAEQASLFKAGTDNVMGMDMFVMRIWRDNSTIASSKPCERCQQFIKLAGIRNVYYSTYNGYGVDYG